MAGKPLNSKIKNAKSLDALYKEKNDISHKLRVLIIFIIITNVSYFSSCFISWQFGRMLYFPPANDDTAFSYFIWLFLLFDVVSNFSVAVMLRRLNIERRDILKKIREHYEDERNKRMMDAQKFEMFCIIEQQKNELLERECESSLFKIHESGVNVALGLVFGTLALIFVTVLLVLQSDNLGMESSKIITSGISAVAVQVSSVFAYSKAAASRNDKVIESLLNKEKERLSLIIACVLYLEESTTQRQSTLSKIAIEMARK